MSFETTSWASFRLASTPLRSTAFFLAAAAVAVAVTESLLLLLKLWTRGKSRQCSLSLKSWDELLVGQCLNMRLNAAMLSRLFWGALFPSRRDMKISAADARRNFGSTSRLGSRAPFLSSASALRISISQSSCVELAVRAGFFGESGVNRCCR